MDEKKPLLIRNKNGVWEDKTEEVIEFRPVPETDRTEVLFKSKPGQWFIYSSTRVRQLGVVLTTHDPTEVQLRIKGELLRYVEGIVKYSDFYLVTSRGRRKPYAVSEVRVERNVAADPACKTVLDYFRLVAEMVGIQNEEDESVLGKQFSYLSRVSDASVLGSYLVPDSKLEKFDIPPTLIYPFGTNVSQKLAVENAFESQVVLVQGPPGTGKTQTILNIVANAIRLGQTVAVVSNNNAATQNVADKLEKQGLGFMLAALGKRANKVAFLEQQIAYPDWVKQSSEAETNVAELEKQLKSLSATLGRLIQANNERALLVARTAQIQAEFDLHLKLEGTSPSTEVRVMSGNLLALDLLRLLIASEEEYPNSKTSLFQLIKEIFLYGFVGRRRRRKHFSAGPMVLRTLYYEAHLRELNAQVLMLESVLAEGNFEDVQQQVQQVSLQLLRAAVKQKYCQRKERPQFSGEDFWRSYGSFLGEYPVVLSTTHSIKTSLSPDCLYDLMIVDESSQVDAATGVLALSCAKRAVIVGDENQLPNVVPSDTKLRALELWEKCGFSCEAWNYANNSLLSSAKAMWPQAPNVLLREHYRCHPKIAGFFNQKFYNNQLIVMTADHGETDVMQVVFTAPGNHARGRVNQRQAEVIKKELEPDLLRRGVTDIGIIAPYKAQVAMLKATLGNSVEVSTVHGFQGREKQAIIMSTVDNEIGEFVDDPKLLNVAVSRAQRSFTVILSEEQNKFDTNFSDLVRYIRHQQQLVSHSQVCSVFDLLYADYAVERKRYLDEHGRTSEWESESLIEVVIRSVLTQPQFSSMSLSCMRHAPLSWLVGDLSKLPSRERRFALHPWSHVDFLVYDTIGKVPLLGIEVDGWAFHRPGSLQAERDEIKNTFFQCIDLRLVRLSTTGSNEVAVISAALEDAVCLVMQPKPATASPPV